MPYHRTTDEASTSSIASTVVVAGSCCALALYYMHQIRKHHGEKSLSFLNSVIPKSLQQQQAREQNLKEKKKVHTTTTTITTRDETSIHSSVLDSIGNTPLVKVLSLSEMTKCEIYAKCEFYNPGGSVKDRVALQIVQEAMERKKLNKGGLVTEGTAGSTGVSLAMVASVLRLNCHVVMPDDAATEKSAQVLAYGATVERVRPVSITHADHFVNVAKRRAEESNEQFGEGSGYFADQFENLANFRAHYNGTGKEIYEQMIDNEKKLDAFVCATGTGGTLAGVATYLQKMQPSIKCFAADPQGSGVFNKVTRGVMFSNVEREGTRKRNPYDTITEGVGINRITKNNALVLEPQTGSSVKLYGAYRVTDAQAVAMSRWLCARDGLFIGSSSAVNLVSALMCARELGEGKVIVTIACDAGLRHMSKFWNDEVIARHDSLADAATFGSDLDLTPEEFLHGLLSRPTFTEMTNYNDVKIPSPAAGSPNRWVSAMRKLNL